MLVRILKDVFDSGQHFDELDNLLSYFRKGSHFLLLDDIDDIDAFNASEWKKGLNPRDIKLIDFYLKSSIKSNKSNKTIGISQEDPQVNFSPKEAEMYLGQPLVILLENSEYDPPFMNAIFKHFDDDHLLIRAKAEQRWKYGMGGGAAIPSVIKSEINESFSDKCFVKPKKTYLRYFVILDSDKKYPDMVVESSKHEVLDENDVPYHILYKREKENYVPLTILKKLGSKYFDVYIAFKKNEQRDFFDMEKGFLKQHKDLSAEIKNLYPERDVSGELYKILRKGIDLDIYKGGKIKREFSKLFNDASREEMLSIISHQRPNGTLNEYEYIINEVKKIL